MRVYASPRRLEIFRGPDSIQQIPGWRYEKGRECYTLPLSHLALERLLLLHPEAEVSDEIRAACRLLDRDDPSLIEPIPSWSLLGPPWDHQIRGTRWQMNQRRSVLQYGMGTGKTRITLDAMRIDGALLTVVVAPNRVCRVWRKQAEVHHPEHFRVVLINEGEMKARVGRLQFACTMARQQRRPTVVVVNYDACWRDPLCEELIKARFDLLVLDEVHRIKGASAKASTYMRRLAGYIGRVRAMSGTLLAQSPVDAYAIFRSVDPAVFGTSKAMFEAEYCIMGGFKGKEVVGYKNLDEFRRRYYSITLAADRDVLDLPPVMIEEVEVEIPAAAKRVHDKLYEETSVELTRRPGEPVTVVQANNVLTRFLRMQQIAAGHVGAEQWKDGAPSRVLEWVHEAKKKELADYLRDIDEHEPVVVFARFTADIEQAAQACAAAGRRFMECSGRVDESEAWEGARGGEVMVAQIQAGSEGLDFTRARYGVWWDQPFSLFQWQQSMCRISRPGQTRPCHFSVMMAKGTIDRYVATSLKRNQDVIQRVLEGDLDIEMAA